MTASQWMQKRYKSEEDKTSGTSMLAVKDKEREKIRKHTREFLRNGGRVVKLKPCGAKMLRGRVNEKYLYRGED